MVPSLLFCIVETDTRVVNTKRLCSPRIAESMFLIFSAFKTHAFDGTREQCVGVFFCIVLSWTVGDYVGILTLIDDVSDFLKPFARRLVFNAIKTKMSK